MNMRSMHGNWNGKHQNICTGDKLISHRHLRSHACKHAQGTDSTGTHTEEASSQATSISASMRPALHEEVEVYAASHGFQ